MSIILNQNINDILNLITQPINNHIVRLIKHNDNVSDIVLHLDIDSIPIKITTDFEKFCLAESPIDLFDLNKFNLKMVFNSKKPDIILKEISNSIKLEQNHSQKINFSDPYHIFQKLEEYTKYKIDYSKLDKEFAKYLENNKTRKVNNKIPKELLLNQSQINNLIKNEIKKLNRNHSFLHYVVPNESNPYTLILRFRFDEIKPIGQLMKQIEKNFGYDYMEMKLILDPSTHPFMPPKLEYIKPKIKMNLLLSLMDLNIFKLENWNPTVTLDYFVEKLGQQLESVALDQIQVDAESNGNTTFSYSDLEYELIKLSSITKEKCQDQINIQINIPKINKESESGSKYWRTGTGYGMEGLKEWDIKSYIAEQEVQKEELGKILSNLKKMIRDDNFETIMNSVLITYMLNQIRGLNMLELEKNKIIFEEIFGIMTKMIGKPTSQKIINEFGMGLKSLNEELDMLFKSSDMAMKDEFLLQTYCLSDYYLSKYQEPVSQLEISSDIKESYCQIMKGLQYGTYTIPSDHRFRSNINKKPDQKSMMRILSEISSFKTGLPLNWESSIWVRISKENINLFSFLISGPKDTPYENGLFEFHAHLPTDYPNSTPGVLIHTTGKNTVRFNPNLYAEGKVCLSLLGTWSGQDGEKWNPKTSTFLQVMVSIQSLILVEQPYFNEPGFERSMGTNEGKKKSDSYNEERLPHTIKLAMIDMIKNPPGGFEDVVKNHFRLKKDEIKNRTLIWEQNASTYIKAIQKNREELIELLDTL